MFRECRLEWTSRPARRALDAVRAFDDAMAREVDESKRLITDSRGLPIDPTTPMSAGSILRLVVNRGGARDAARTAR